MEDVLLVRVWLHEMRRVGIEGRITYTSGTVELVLAEAISVKEVLTWIKCNQWQHVTEESDCLGVVQTLRSSIRMISLFGQVIQSCSGSNLRPTPSPGLILAPTSRVWVRVQVLVQGRGLVRVSIWVWVCLDWGRGSPPKEESRARVTNVATLAGPRIGYTVGRIVHTTPLAQAKPRLSCSFNLSLELCG
uniref:Uncharacterized protein n=1 Tax=Cannabis sativa TaxID=3483 RepID=A0A803PNI2_CANSA